MFVMRHHLRATYDARPLPGGTKNPEMIAREAAENCPVCNARAETESKETKEKVAFLGEFLHRYDLKVAAERRHRLAGEIVATDFVLRQLTHIELILDGGGCGPDPLERYTTRPGAPGSSPQQINASPISQELDRRRRAIWAKAGDPPRPRLALSQWRWFIRWSSDILRRLRSRLSLILLLSGIGSKGKVVYQATGMRVLRERS